jgi:trehalose/maltose hydrolase-like predicted phosphorylase/hydroxymethylpyrimidine pyrophosphatase-like HAD family hydrolase
MSQGVLGDHRYRLIAFDWDGTAVASRSEHPGHLADAMDRLLQAGVTLVIITGTNAKNVSGQLGPFLNPAALSRLYLMVNRGSEVFAYSASGELDLLWRREASVAENTALDATAAAVQDALREQYGIEVAIISNRLNRRKIDLIPTPEWADPPKARIGELLKAVEERLEPVPGGIAEVIALTNRMAAANGLPDARITSDVKHVEVGLTDKSDSIAFLMRRLAPMRAIQPHEVLIAGDEFGPIAGFEGSDYRMVTRLAQGATIVSVGREPNGVPPGVVHVGGGPDEFVRLLERQFELIKRRPTPPLPPPVRAIESVPSGDGWLVVSDGYSLVGEASQDTLFALVNGYMGVRGSSDEPSPGSSPGAYVAGLYDGPGDGAEDMVVIPDWTTTDIMIDGKPFTPWEWRVRSHRRTLDLAAMRLERDLVCQDGDGRVLRLWSERVLNLGQPHLAGTRLRLSLQAGPPANVGIQAGIRAPEVSGPLPHVEVMAAGHADGIDLLHTRTPAARVAVDVAQVAVAHTEAGPVATTHTTEESFSGCVLEALLEPGDTLTLERHVAVFTERDQALPAPAAADTARASAAAGWPAMLADHRAAWSTAWSRAEVLVDGDPEVQIGLRFAVAHLVAAAPPVESRASIGAKGLTGGGYKGHVFWDTDVFLEPFYSLTMPKVARQILEYRLASLPAARRHAQDAGLSGAWFGWETAATGEDVTPDFVVGPGGRHLDVLTGKQEIHVVADVAWAVDAYVRASGDVAFLADGGGEMIVEAARFFASRGVETERGYEIHQVIGPDELHEGVDNSAFTNTMAAWTLRRAAALVDSGVRPALDGESLRWVDLANRMVVLRTPDGLLEQHEGFLSLPVAGRGPQDRSELAWQRDRMEWRDVKQADVVMLMALLEPLFPPEERLAHFRLYEPLTRHLSSLSEAVHSLVARRVRLDDPADDYLKRAIAIDLHDSRGNRQDGVHMATQGGLWQAVVLGCGGVRAEDGVLHLDPHPAPHWERLRFALTHRGTPLTVTITPDEVVVEAHVGMTPIALPGYQGVAAADTPVRLTRSGTGWRLAA